MITMSSSAIASDCGMQDATPKLSVNDSSSGSISSSEQSTVDKNDDGNPRNDEEAMATKRRRSIGTNGRRRRPPYADYGREYHELMTQVGLNQLECGEIFGYAGRTSRRYKRGEGKVPLSALKLLRLIARGKLTKRQVIEA